MGCRLTKTFLGQISDFPKYGKSTSPSLSVDGKSTVSVYPIDFRCICKYDMTCGKQALFRNCLTGHCIYTLPLVLCTYCMYRMLSRLVCRMLCHAYLDYCVLLIRLLFPACADCRIVFRSQRVQHFETVKSKTPSVLQLVVPSPIYYSI